MGMSLMFRRHEYIVEKNFLGITYSKEKGRTDLISEVSLDYQPHVSSNQHHHGYRIAGLTIVSATSPVRNLFKKHTLGKGLSDVELSWLVKEIKGWLSSNVEGE
jgi:hypothetical protein